MAGKFGPNVLIALVLLLLDLGAFFVLLGAAAALQHNGTTIAPLLTSMSSTLVTGDLTPTSIARRFISYEWFKAVLQAVILLFSLGALATGQFHRFRIAICCLLAITTVLFCDAAQTFYYLHIQTDAAEAVVGKPIVRQVRCWFAGCMMSAALNMLLILTIGSGLSEGRHVDRYNDSARTPNVKGYNDGPGTGTGTGTTTVV